MPAKLNIEKARPNERYEIRDDGRSPPGQQKQRLGTTRTASEPRGPPARQMSSRESPRSRQQVQRRQSDEDEDGYPEELYDMYSSSRNSRNPPRKQPKYIEEEEEDASDYDDGSFDENDFEMVSSRPPPRRAPSSVGGGSGRGASRRPDIRKIRVKVHSEDVRYIMIGAAVEFPDLVDRIRDKFGLRKRFKIKVRDDDLPDGDMITLGDQDDLDMIIMSVKNNAKKERQDMGKMEVKISTLPFPETFTNFQI
jgi:hypothetical protein